MTILITGGSGYIGSHIALALLDKGQSVIVGDLKRPEGKFPGLGYEPLNICDNHSLEKVFGDYDVDTVIHMAADISVPESMENPVKYYNTNVVGTLNVIKAAKAYGTKNFVFASSAAVYNKDLGWAGEAHALEPANPYGTTKLAGEQMIREILGGSDMGWATMRIFNVGGADKSMRTGPRDFNGAGIVKRIAQAAIGVAPLAIYGRDHRTGDGTAVRDYIHVSDVAEAFAEMALMLDRFQSPPIYTTVNVSSGQATSILQLIAAAEEITGNKITYGFERQRPGDVSFMVGHNSKIKRLLQWEPKHSDVYNIMATAIEWERTDYRNTNPFVRI